jgi:sugar/nucleoside kinase (ribokinase family)
MNSIEPSSKSLRGEVPPIRKFGGQPQLEDVAFGLKPNEFLGKNDFDVNPKAEAEKYRRDDQWVLLVRGKGRLGIYYLEAGVNQRPSKVIYDRAGSAIALAKPGDIDWNAAFEGAGWFHVTGITPAISATAAELSLEAVRRARDP